MIYLPVALFAVAAVLGVAILVKWLQDQEAPKAIVYSHGGSCRNCSGFVNRLRDTKSDQFFRNLVSFYLLLPHSGDLHYSLPNMFAKKANCTGRHRSCADCRRRICNTTFVCICLR